VVVRSVRSASIITVLALTLIGSACASSSTTTVPLPSVSTTAFPEFVQPAIPAAFGR